MPPDQFAFHKQEIAKLSKNGWIGPTYSPICAPSIMVDKQDDGSGEKKIAMVVNYQELNALNIAPEFPMPSIQTLEMLGGAKCFSTLDLEAGFHKSEWQKRIGRKRHSVRCLGSTSSKGFLPPFKPTSMPSCNRCWVKE